jgi:sugar transferase EpsL
MTVRPSPWLTAMRGGPIRAWLRDAIKRLIDIAVSAGALLALSPVIALLVVLELVFHGWPPLFTQVRPGRGERLFRMMKFRSMTNARGPDGELLPDDVRLTRFGRWLRSTSLDELPELVNILMGHMSLVGPRPLLPSYLRLYTPEQARRHEVKPGLTGWVAVNGRNLVSWEERFRLDTWYVENRTTRLDLSILVRTVATVLGRKGVSAEGHQTMPAFTGRPLAADAP